MTKFERVLVRYLILILEAEQKVICIYKKD